MFDVAYAAIGAVGVECLPVGVLRAHDVRELAARGAAVDVPGRESAVDADFQIFVVDDGVALDVLAQRSAVHALAGEVEQSALGQFAEDAEDAACAVLLLDAVLLPVRSELAEERHFAREGIDVLHLEVYASFLSHGQEVEHGVGGGSHGDVERHGIEEGLARGDAARQNRVVALLVVGEGVLHDEPCGALEEAYAVLVRSQDASVAGQRESDGFGQGVHGVGREHAGAGSASGAGHLLHLCQLLVADCRVAALYHGCDEVGILAAKLVRFHRSAADEDGRDVQSHGSHQHAGRHLVAVGDADHGVGLVCVDHVLHRVGDDVARG